MERTNSGIMELSLNSTEKRMLENNVFVLKGILKLHEKTVSGVLSPDMDFAPYDPYKNAGFVDYVGNTRDFLSDCGVVCNGRA